uniref:Aldo_ket_red domain-containing protein n=1 Tax=Haemonchus placei TaxID=6290 RepID=A0A0N4VSL9_HAEPC
LWVTHLHPNDIEDGIRESLGRLQLGYVDLLLAHMPTCFNHDMTAQDHSVTVQDIWHGLEDVYKKGLARAIGVSNWNGEQIERTLKTATVPIHNCQVELHLYWPQHELHDLCKKHNISVTSYASLGSPGRTDFKAGIDFQRDAEWAPAPNAMEDPQVKRLAFKYTKTPAQILLRYLIDRNIAVIPKSITPSRIVENFKSSPAEVKTATKAAIEAGYRLIDTAAVYQNEEAIGEAIKELIQAGKVTREELFITTKVWATHMHPDDTEGAIRESLRHLQLDYVDLYLAHMPVCFNHEMSAQNHDVPVHDIWRGLEGVYKKGLAKAIGVSNWNGEQIERVMKTASVPIHNCQVELHLYWPQHELQEVCKKHNISLTSYASLGSPGRVNFTMPGIKNDWAPAPNAFEDEYVKELAKKYSKTPAQILLRYLVDRNIAIIPKSVSPSRIVENFQVFLS